ncbi:unnamed protein product [Leptosia nina]|uniref:Reverse transcriptase domain-containing protein n=1 Tax=Leptosia nina TaxID=320188 RepID=A0AAV1J9Q2_9NEOP
MNAMLRLQYFPDLWKISEIIMIYKAGKPANEKTSYRPISLLPTISKLFEKILLDRIMPYLVERKIIPDHQFGFRRQHGTIEQVHRVCEYIRSTLEQKEYCSAAFLDVQQAFDRVWHKGLLCKIKENLPHTLFTILKSYLTDRLSYVRESEECSTLLEIKAGVPQGSILGPILYVVYTADLPVTPGTMLATFADDRAILACHSNPDVASSKLQEALNRIHSWLERWRIKASAAKSVHVTFTLRTGNCPSVTLGNNTLPQSNCVRYLGIHLDQRLTWRQHINAKKEEISLKHNNLYWMLSRNSKLSLDNKLLIYKTVIKPIWMYGIQLWGSASDSNINILQRQENKILRTMANVPWFVRNSELHEHLRIGTVKDEIRSAAVTYRKKLTIHPNELARQLTINKYTVRLKRHHIMEHIH